MIKIYVGDDIDPIYVSQSLLVRNSDVFGNILHSEHVASHDTLHFPDDSVSAWRIMLFWMVYKQMPAHRDTGEHQEAGVMDIVGAWCLSDHYCMWEFQDATMSLLIGCLHDIRDFPIDAIQAGFEYAKTSSRMGRLMVNGAVWSLRYGAFCYSNPDALEGVEGFHRAFTDALGRRGRHHNKNWLAKLPDRCNEYLISIV
jgi:hypothetical protein